jgi:hypothetical protein
MRAPPAESSAPCRLAPHSGRHTAPDRTRATPFAARHPAELRNRGLTGAARTLYDANASLEQIMSRQGLKALPYILGQVLTFRGPGRASGGVYSPVALAARTSRPAGWRHGARPEITDSCCGGTALAWGRPSHVTLATAPVGVVAPGAHRVRPGGRTAGDTGLAWLARPERLRAAPPPAHRGPHGVWPMLCACRASLWRLALSSPLPKC